MAFNCRVFDSPGFLDEFHRELGLPPHTFTFQTVEVMRGSPTQAAKKVVICIGLVLAGVLLAPLAVSAAAVTLVAPVMGPFVFPFMGAVGSGIAPIGASLAAVIDQFISNKSQYETARDSTRHPMMYSNAVPVRNLRFAISNVPEREDVVELGDTSSIGTISSVFSS